MKLYNGGTQINIDKKFSRFDNFIFCSSSRDTAESFGPVIQEFEINEDEIATYDDIREYVYRNDDDIVDWLANRVDDVFSDFLEKDDILDIKEAKKLAYKFICFEDCVFDLIARDQCAERLFVNIDSLELSELQFDVQLAQAKVAEKLGFKSLAVLDETGESVMINTDLVERIV